VMLPPDVKDNTVARGAAGALVAVPFVWLLLKLAYRKLTLRYRLTNQRLIVLRGFLHRTQDETELYRVDDVQVSQSIVGRVFNVGDVIVFAPTDKTEPRSCLAGIAAPEAVKEQIRECVRKFKDRAIRMEQI
ncbi:MAG TPA: PH domain-containing protein, partial [Planctomycetota bacterium]|nr:PH domain-containing protein [Planctomycetota bacterium]